jgi:hypothetical protein
LRGKMLCVVEGEEFALRGFLRAAEARVDGRDGLDIAVMVHVFLGHVHGGLLSVRGRVCERQGDGGDDGKFRGDDHFFCSRDDF